MAIERILLLPGSAEQVNMPVHPAGLHLVAEAASLAGYAVQTLDLSGVRGPGSLIREAVSEHRPDLVGLSVRNIDDQDHASRRFFLQDSRELVQLVRSQSDAPIVLGGAGYSIFPESALDFLGADLGLAGEGEASFVQLLAALNGRGRLEDVPGVCLPGRGLLRDPQRIKALDGCPWPDPEVLDPALRAREEFWMPFQTRRGCPLGCSYCSTGRIEGRAIRKRSLDGVLTSLRRFEQAGIRRFFMVDNTFNLPEGYAEALCRSMAEAGLDISWRAIVYPKRISRALARAMARAGCSDVSLGFESGCPEILQAMNKRFGPDDIRQASDRFAEAGIKRVGFLLLGGPGETEDTVRRSLAFVESLGLEALKITVGIRIYPGTLLARQASAKGLIRPDQSLLRPVFFLQPELADWLPGFIESWSAQRPNLVVG